jgi:hypothetical protein
MKKLSKDELARVVREMEECPALVRWIRDSRIENHEHLDGCAEADFKHLQGQNDSLNQILDKVPRE